LNDGVVGLDVGDCNGYVWFFNASIYYDGSAKERSLRWSKGMIKILEVLEEIFIQQRRERVETNSTREIIDYPWAWRKKRKHGIEVVSNAVETFVDIFDGAFEVGPLFVCEFGGCDSV